VQVYRCDRCQSILNPSLVKDCTRGFNPLHYVQYGGDPSFILEICLECGNKLKKFMNISDGNDDLQV
jgi:hypothetical protein